MPGVEAERAATDDTRVGLLAYVQDSTRAAWATHHEQHDLEDKALALAVGGVKEALELAVSRVEQAQLAQRELLEERITSLRAALVVEHDELDRRSEERDRAAREMAEVRISGAEQYVKDIAEQRWASHGHLHEVARNTENDKNEAWKTAHLREHVLIQLAVDKASDALSLRLEGMNEFRAQLDRMVATLVTLDVLDVRLASVNQRLDKADDIIDRRVTSLERSSTRSEGRNGGYAAFWGYIVGATGVGIALILLIRDLVAH